MKFAILLLSAMVYGQNLRSPILSQTATSLSFKLPDRTNRLMSEPILPKWHLPGQKPNITGGTLMEPLETLQRKCNFYSNLLAITQTHNGWSELKWGFRAVWMPTKKLSLGVQRLNGKLGGELLTFIRYN